MRVRVIAGWILATAFIFMSGKSFIENGELTTESWGFLLLTPLAFALALSPNMPWESEQTNDSEWDDEEEVDSVTQLQTRKSQASMCLFCDYVSLRVSRFAGA